MHERRTAAEDNSVSENASLGPHENLTSSLPQARLPAGNPRPAGKNCRGWRPSLPRGTKTAETPGPMPDLRWEISSPSGALAVSLDLRGRDETPRRTRFFTRFYSSTLRFYGASAERLHSPRPRNQTSGKSAQEGGRMSTIGGIGAGYGTTMLEMGQTRMPRRPDPEAMASQAFSRIDTTGRGYIEKADLQSAMSASSSATGSTTSVNVDDLFTKLDGDGDGKVTKDEFSSGSKAIFEEMRQKYGDMGRKGMGRMGGMGGPGGMPPGSPPADSAGFTKDELTSQIEEIGSSADPRATLSPASSTTSTPPTPTATARSASTRRGRSPSRRTAPPLLPPRARRDPAATRHPHPAT